MAFLWSRQSYSPASVLVSLRCLPVRLAKVLLSFMSDAMEVCCQQEELAYLLGVTRVSVNRALKTLAQEGLARRGYGVVYVSDDKKLARWVDEEGLVVPVTAVVLNSKVPNMNITISRPVCWGMPARIIGKAIRTITVPNILVRASVLRTAANQCKVAAGNSSRGPRLRMINTPKIIATIPAMLTAASPVIGPSVGGSWNASS